MLADAYLSPADLSRQHMAPTATALPIPGMRRRGEFINRNTMPCLALPMPPDQYLAYLKPQFFSAISSFTAPSLRNISLHSQGVETLLSEKIASQDFYGKSHRELLAKNLADIGINEGCLPHPAVTIMFGDFS